MLMPRRVKHRKQHHPKRTGAAKGGTRLAFGEFGIQAVELALRHQPTDRVGPDRDDPAHQAWWKGVDQHLPDRPLTKKPAETRMGSGKGPPEWWVANVKPGRVLFKLPVSTS